MTNPEAVLHAIRSRRSIRQFTDQTVERADIEQLVEAACWAPSNHNRQGWKFIVLEDRQLIRDLARQVRACVTEKAATSNVTARVHLDEIVYYAGLFENAPIVILAMHKRVPAVGRQILESASSTLVSGEVLSTAMAVQNLCLLAHVRGLGTCVMTAPLLAGDVWRELPDLPAGFEPTCLVALGYPAERPDPPRRKQLKHVIEYR